MAYLSKLLPNISWIEEVCDTLDTTPLTSIVDNHWPTAVLHVNLSFLKAGIKSNTLFLIEGITILPKTLSTGCGGQDVPGYKLESSWRFCDSSFMRQ